MRAADREPKEWVDGFLFVGNRLILDFLNTKPVLDAGPTELLADTHALERWLIASGLAETVKAKRLLRGWRVSEAAKVFLKHLIAFRERLRSAVVRMEGGTLPAESFVAEVNALLMEHPGRTHLSRRDGAIVRERKFEPCAPEDFWGPIVEDAAELLAETEPARLRKCEACVVHFFDTSKKGSRRWCSMNLCGNKLKVAAYQQRRRKRSPAY
ncbi:MAG: ABATE domain-containing protein [Acidobacteriaceae bacterium]